MIMGRKTFASFDKPLPGRRHIVLTRDRDWHAEGAEVVHTPHEALALVGDDVVALIGGAEIFRVMLPLCERVELTEIHAEFDGDTVMPALGPAWHEVTREEQPAEDSRPTFAFVTLERSGSRAA